MVKPRWQVQSMMWILLVVIGVVLALVFLRQPQMNRNWSESLAVLPQIVTDGSQVTIKNVRDWRWDAQGAVSRNYLDETVSMDEIKNVWFVLEPFENSPLVGHTFLLFEYEDGRLIGLTVEARKERDQKYSAWRGAFNAYELIYVWGTADDLLGQRANYLAHPQYIWRLSLSSEQKSALFQALSDKTNALTRKPRFYNTLFSNCTNELAKSAGLAWGRGFILTGRSVAYLRDAGFIQEVAEIPQDISPFVTSLPQRDRRNDAELVARFMEITAAEA